MSTCGDDQHGYGCGNYGAALECGAAGFGCGASAYGLSAYDGAGVGNAFDRMSAGAYGEATRAGGYGCGRNAYGQSYLRGYGFGKERR